MILKLEKARKDSWTHRKFFEGTAAKLGPSIDFSGLPVTGLDEKSQAKFEKELQLEKGTLARTSDYWNNFVIVVDADGTKFNDQEQLDQLKITFLKAQSNVASGRSELLSNSKAEYILYSEDEEATAQNKVRRVKVDAIKKAAELTATEQRGIVFMYGHNPNNMSPDAIEKFVFDKVDEDPKFFMILMEDPQKDMKIFIHTLVKAGILETRGSAYMYDEDIIGYGLTEVAIELAKLENQELRIALEKRLKSKQ